MKTRTRIYATTIIILIALYALMVHMDRAAAELDARPSMVSTIRMHADEFSPWNHVAMLPMVESWECR